MLTHQADIIFAELQGPYNKLGLITLNRPHALNALTQAMTIAMHNQLHEWAQNIEIKAIIIRGAGERAFCAGGDIRKLYEAGTNPVHPTSDFFWHEYRLNHTIFHFPKPYIALMDGITMGGGVGVAIHGSHRIATERLKFAMPETAIGYFPDVGTTFQLPRLRGFTGFYLGLTGISIEASDTHYVGATDYFVKSTQLENLINELIQANLTNNSEQKINDVIQSLAEPFPDSKLSAHQDLINNSFNKLSIADIFNTLQAANDTWSEQTLALLKKRSPTSLSATLAALQRGKTLSFDNCLQMEYRLSQRLSKHHDFFEGVRATIIDKDQNPNWQPSKLAEIKEATIANYFLPLEKELSFE